MDVSGVAGTKRTVALVLAGPVIWSVHFMLVYLVAEAGCTGGGPGLEAFDPPVPVVATLVSTAVAVVALAVTAALAFRRWRLHRLDTSDGDGLEPVDRGGSLAFAGGALSLLGIVEVVFVGLPALVLAPC